MYLQISLQDTDVFLPFILDILPGGNSLNNLIELKTININPTDTTVLLLTDCTEVGKLPDILLGRFLRFL